MISGWPGSHNGDKAVGRAQIDAHHWAFLLTEVNLKCRHACEMRPLLPVAVRMTQQSWCFRERLLDVSHQVLNISAAIQDAANRLKDPTIAGRIVSLEQGLEFRLGVACMTSNFS